MCGALNDFAQGDVPPISSSGFNESFPVMCLLMLKEQVVNDIRSLTMFSDSQAAACSNTTKSDYRQLSALALKVPGKELAYAVDLIIVTSLRKARELDPQLL